jgi:hypothetical protein
MIQMKMMKMLLLHADKFQHHRGEMEEADE